MQRSTLWHITILSVAVIFLLVFCFAAFASDNINYNGFLANIEGPKFSNFANTTKTEIGFTNNTERAILAAQPAAILATDGITRGEFIAEIADFFGWPHYDDYNDIWKDPPKHFSDVEKSNIYGKQIESALEEGIIGPAGSAFRPDAPITREEAAVMLANAYKLDTSGTSLLYKDADTISAKGSVAALAALGLTNFPTNSGSTAFNPTEPIDKAEAEALLQEMFNDVVAPVYFLPRPSEKAPRRNVKLYTANPDATIYLTFSAKSPATVELAQNPVEPADPTTIVAGANYQYNEYYTKEGTGYIGFAITSSSDIRENNPIIKAIAVDESKKKLQQSGVTRQQWHIERPRYAPFEDELIFAPNQLGPGSPAVYRIWGYAEEFCAMAWYVEGSERGMVFDALQTTKAETTAGVNASLRDYVVNEVATLAPERIDLVVGHTHPDHCAQSWSFAENGHTVYQQPRGYSALLNYVPDTSSRVNIKLMDEGQQFDLGGGCIFDTYALPAHNNDLVIIQDKKTGLVFATDIFGCTRVGSADDVDVSGVRADLLLSLAQQTFSLLKKDGGKIEYVFSGHDEQALGEINLDLFEKALQLVVDEGDKITHATYRNARRSANYRTVTVGDMYPTLLNASVPDYRQYTGATEWLSIAIGGGSYGATPTYLSSPQNWNNVKINYNSYNPALGGGDGYINKYAQLSNIEFEGAELVGVDVWWGTTNSAITTAAGEVGVNRTALANRFDPWLYEYDIIVPGGTTSIKVLPTTMSTKAQSLKVNDVAKTRGEWTTLNVELGDTIEVEVTSADGSETETYVFTVKAGTATQAIDLNTLLLEKTNKSGTSRSFPSSSIDRSEVIEHPLKGYYTHNFPATLAAGVNVANLQDRTFKLYIGERAPLRTYITVIAVPNGVDTYQFLKNEGWIEQADKYGEILFVLEPGLGGWGTPAEEAQYLAACLQENIGNRGNADVGTRDLSRGILGNESVIVYVDEGNGTTSTCQVAGGHAASYFVGYGEGCGVLESWTAMNPLLVIAQAFIGGESAGDSILDAAALRAYNGVNTGSYFPGVNDTAFKATLASIAENGGLDTNGEFITNADIPVPTLLAGGSYAASDSAAYWKNVNDAVSVADANGIYWQDIKSDAWQTDYANQNIKKWNPGATYGVSKVQVKDNTSQTAADIRAFLADYTRFTWQLAYSNHLNYRLDYFEAAKESRKIAAAELNERDNFTTFTNLAGNSDAKVELHAVASTQVEVPNNSINDSGIVYSVIFAFEDYNSDGLLDGRQAIIYEPDSAQDGAPVVFVHPGATHAPITFMDASHWWAVANDEGCVVVIVGEHNASNAVSLGHHGTQNYDRSLLQLLKEDKIGLGVGLDYSRVYASGHSAGCGTALTLALGTESYFAGVAGTSAAPNSFVATANMMPAYLMAGDADISQNGYDLVGEPWAATGPTSSSAPNLFVKNTLVMNGIDVSFTDKDSMLDTCDYEQVGRYINYTWSNWQDVPLVKFGRTLAREHNCYPEEFRSAWDFLEKFSVEDGIRYYSASGFKQDDAVVIKKDRVDSLEPADLNTATAVAKPGESNQLPLQGYFKANLTAAGYTDREIRYYIPATAILRPYYHFVAVPNNVNVDEFVVSSGWQQVADETGECLFILMPEDGVWGDVAAEKGYIAAARTYHGTNPKGLTTFGMFYLTGYKEGAAPLEAWAAENPHLIIAQSYVGATASAGNALAIAGAESFGWKHMTDGDRGTDANGNQKILFQMSKRLKDILNPDKTGEEGLLTKGDMPIPTWFVNAASSDSLSYWKKVNKATALSADSTVSSFGGSSVNGSIYNQKEDAWPTEYAGRISKVTDITTSTDTDSYAFSKALRDAMTVYTRYDNSISYGNALTYRLDYTAVQVERFASDNAAKASTKTVTGKTLDGNDVAAEVTIELLQVQNNAATVAPTDLLLYIPETAPATKIPVVIVNHGASQNAHLFFDSTAWWQTAAKEGFALVFTTRTGMGGTGAPSTPSTLPLFDEIYDYLREDGRFDMTRIYASGQSAGGNLTITLSQDRTDMLAAAYATNPPGFSVSSSASKEMIPFGLFIGDGNYANRGIPGFVADTSYPEDGTVTYPTRSTAAAAAGADIYWDPVSPTAGFNSWVAYYTGTNGVDNSNLSNIIKYRGGNSLNGGTNKEGTLSEFDTNHARYRTFTWHNAAVPVLEYSFSLYNAHNNIQGYGPLMWDYMKNFSVVDNGGGTVSRYYSASGFKQDDAVLISKDGYPELLTPPTANIGGGSEAIAARGNNLPYTGYYEQTFSGLTGANAALNGRQVRVYIPEGARLREYFTVIALPSNTDVTKFLADSGWFDIADQNKVGLIVAMPGSGGVWGDQTAESAYMTYIVSGAGGARTWYSTINEYYLVGYGDGGDLLQQYAAANPMYVISQAYFDSTVEAPELLVHGNKYYKQENNESSSTTDEPAVGVSSFAPVQKKSIPVPSLLVGGSMDAGAIQYWLNANECTSAAAAGTGPLSSNLYTQVKNRAIATSFNDVVAYTAVKEASEDYAKPEVSNATYAFLSQYTRYDVSSAFGNALGWRLPGSEYERVPLQAVHAGVTYNREYIIYTPAKAKDKALYPDGAPVLFVFAGMTQPNSLFFDSSQWYDVASTYGFTVVVPCATTQSNAINTAWSQTGTGFTRDEAFVKMVMNDIETKDVEGNINFNRLFVTGQSQGGGFTYYLAAANPNLFTAVSYTSAQGVPSSATYTMPAPPIYFIYGEHDTQQPTNSQARWLQWHGFNAADAINIPSGLPQAKDNDIGYIIYPNSDEYPGSRYEKWVWYDEDGIPQVMRATNLGRSHNNIVSDSWQLWEDWFCKWDRDAEGNRVYNSTVVPEPIPVEGEMSNLKLYGADALVFNFDAEVDNVTAPVSFGVKVNDETAAFVFESCHNGIVTLKLTEVLADPVTAKVEVTVVATGQVLTALWSGDRDNLLLTTEATDVKEGDEFTLTTSFKKAVSSNAAILSFTFDKTKFEYVEFTPYADVKMLHKEDTATGVQITVMVEDYNTTTYGDLTLRAKKGAILADEKNEIKVLAQYVVKPPVGDKFVASEEASTIFNTVVVIDPPVIVYDLITLSNMIDVFGMTSAHEDWDKHKAFDFNGNGEIDIDDIATFASKIEK